jgi:hypothetical protein
MIWRSLICFSFAAFAAPGATLSGTIVLRDSRIEAVNRQKDFSGVVVSAQPVSSQPVSGQSSDGQIPPPLPAPHATMLQKGKTFTPHVLPVVSGTTVDFPNSDPIFHNAFSSYSGQIFDIGLYPPGTSRAVKFTRTGVLRVFCNIHPTMSAVILVLNTPWFVKTARNGSFEMNVPPGEYQLSVFHERATEEELAGLSQRILVSGKACASLPLRSRKPAIWWSRTRINMGMIIRRLRTIRFSIRGQGTDLELSPLRPAVAVLEDPALDFDRHHIAFGAGRLVCAGSNAIGPAAQFAK